MLGWWTSPKVLVIRYAIGGAGFLLIGVLFLTGLGEDAIRDVETDTIQYRQSALKAGYLWLSDTFGQTTTGIVGCLIAALCFWRAKAIHRMLNQ